MRDTINKPDRHIRRLPPCPSYDVEGMESWLADMASRGWLLIKDGFFAGIATFEMSRPCHMKYRLEAAPKSTSIWSDGGGTPDEEAIAISQKYGWEYIASRGEFYIYRTENAEARELNTDPHVQAIALNTVRRRQRSALISCFFWAFLSPFLYMRTGLLLTMIHVGTWLYLFGVALLIWILASSLARVIHLGRLRKKLLSGDVLDHHKPWKGKAARYHAGNALQWILILVWFGIVFHNWSISTMDEDKISLESYTSHPPFATMGDFAPEGQYRLDDFGISNTVKEWTDWLTPYAMDWDEIATVALPDGTYISGGLYVNYYEAVSSWLANALAREYLRVDRHKKDCEELTPPSLDVDYTAAYMDSLHFPTLILQDGNKIMRVRFYQTSSSRELPFDEWAQLMADSIVQP